MELDQKLSGGVQKYLEKRYGEAERVATEILHVDADNVRALNLLGMALHRQGRSDEGSRLVLKATKLRPEYVAAYNNLATIHWEGGDPDSALRILDEAIGVAPETADCYQNKALILLELGRYEDTARCLQKCVELNPRVPATRTSLGAVLSRLGRDPEALEHHEAAIALDPACADAWLNRGNALHKLARLDEALASYDRAIALRADYAEAFSNRANTLRDLGRPQEAVESYDRAIALKPDYPAALTNRGSALWDLRRFPEALASYDRALACDPDHYAALLSRASPLRDLKRPAEALASCDRAIALRPEDPDACNIRGSVLWDMARYEEALESYDRALALKADHCDALHNRGNLFAELGHHDDAIRTYERLLELSPGQDFLKGELLHQKMLNCDWRELAPLAESIGQDLAAGKKSAEPFGYQAIAVSEQDLRTCAEIYTADKFPPAPDPMYSAEPHGNLRIRVGYLCGEFRQQATSVLITELFERHDKERFEIFAFDNGWDDKSELRGRINRAFDEVVDVSRLADHEAARAVRERKIDILVNLNGYFGKGRQGVFARKPSPVQVNYLGFPGTTGADYIDYIIADRHVIPVGHEVHYTEKVVHLPDSYQVNDSKRRIADEAPTRAGSGLPEQGFVFCCFNNNYKITPGMFDVWMRLLDSVEGSVLWLLGDRSTASSNLRREAEARGVAPERIVFAERARLDRHLARHRLADLFLDTIPYNAHTTASDALWAGLPLLTCLGTTFPGRVAASLLHAVGLPELVTRSLQEYEMRARELATAPALLADLREKLARHRPGAPLFDSGRFCRHLESAYATMWSRYQHGDPPAGFSVSSHEPAR